ncbi:MAG TPA: choice-of-anchor P family protein [Vicinamibacterales bacterium]|jgi:hypothetical protein
MPEAVSHTPDTVPGRWTLIALCLAALGWPTQAAAQTVSGQARVAQTTVVDLQGTATTVLADTGTLGDSNDARQASQLTANIPSVLAGGVLHATTIGWPDRVASEASLADLALTVAGNTIGADFVMARATAVQGAPGAAAVHIDSLSINGIPIFVSSEPNQTIPIPGGRMVINEQQQSQTGIRVNALHVIVDGVADVVVGSAIAGVQ